MTNDEWESLRSAARQVHLENTQPGGSAICVCGAGGGSSSACAALAQLRNAILYLDTSNLGSVDRGAVMSLRKVM